MFRRGSIYWTTVGGARTSLRTSEKADAEALEAKLKHEHYQTEYLGYRSRSWEEAIARWGKENEHKISWKDDVRIIRWWSQFFAGWDIRKITREVVDETIQTHRSPTQEASGRNNTANHYVVCLASILNAAARKWDWIGKAPLLRRYPAPDGRKRWLSVGEWKALEEALPPDLRRAATFALATGVRRGKLVCLAHADLDISSRSLSFSGTSNKLGNTIPLNDTAMGVLEEIQSSPVRHLSLVFTKDGRRLGHYQKEWYKALDKCGLRGRGEEDFCWHGLRHTWASWLAQAGVPEFARKRLGGWASSEMVDRYSHLDLEALRPYAAVIDRILKVRDPQHTDYPLKEAAHGLLSSGKGRAGER